MAPAALGRGTLDPDTASWSMHVRGGPASSSSSSAVLWERGGGGGGERGALSGFKSIASPRRRRLLAKRRPRDRSLAWRRTLSRAASELCNVRGERATLRDLARPLPDENEDDVGGSSEKSTDRGDQSASAGERGRWRRAGARKKKRLRTVVGEETLGEKCKWKRALARTVHTRVTCSS